MTFCATCGHSEPDHRVVCGVQQCCCLFYIPDSGLDLPIDDVSCWESLVMTGVLELLTSHQEGEVHVKTDDGRECIAKIVLRPNMPITCKGGRA